MGYVVYIILGLALLFIFPGIVSCILVILGFFFNLLFFPIELLSMYIYPVGSIVYITLFVLVAYLIYSFGRHHLLIK